MGMGYGYVEHETEPDICFNYLGDFQSKENNREIVYSYGESIASENIIPNKLSINGQVYNGVLSFSIVSIENVFGTKFLEKLKKEFINSVDQLAVFCAENKYEMQIYEEKLLNDKKEKYVKSFEQYDETVFDMADKRKKVLLTGCTGYLGVNILYQLLLNTNSDVTVLVRKRDESFEKMINRLWNHHFLEDIPEIWLRRIKCIYGNLSDDKFGIAEKEYAHLVDNIDIIINAAANVNLYGESSAYAVNIAGVRNLIEFTQIGKKKTLNHISTLSVASGTIPDCKKVLYTEDDLDLGQQIEGVYVKSKFEGEKLIEMARKNGANINIMRVGNLQCNSRTGSFQINSDSNWFASIIKTISITGMYTQNMSEAYYNFSPVDQTAEACMKLAFSSSLKNQNFHVLSDINMQLSDIIKFLEKIKKVSDEELAKFLQTYNGNQKEILLFYNQAIDNPSGGDTIFDAKPDRTNYILKKLGFEWHKVSDNIIKKYVEHIDTGV